MIYAAFAHEEHDYNCSAERLISLHASPEGARAACEADWAGKRAKFDRSERYADLVWREREHEGRVYRESDAESLNTYCVEPQEVLP